MWLQNRVQISHCDMSNRTGRILFISVMTGLGVGNTLSTEMRTLSMAAKQEPNVLFCMQTYKIGSILSYRFQ
jgi:hypothetical protein